MARCEGVHGEVANLLTAMYDASTEARRLLISERTFYRYRDEVRDDLREDGLP
jgi:hypothetical protein